MLKIQNGNPSLTPIEEVQNRSFGFVQNLASAAALDIVIKRLEEVELALSLFGEDESHEEIMPILIKDQKALEKAIIELAMLKSDEGISA